MKATQEEFPLKKLVPVVMHRCYASCDTENICVTNSRLPYNGVTLQEREERIKRVFFIYLLLLLRSEGTVCPENWKCLLSAWLICVLLFAVVYLRWAGVTAGRKQEQARSSAEVVRCCNELQRSSWAPSTDSQGLMALFGFTR